jgi:hypothetical protein
MGAKQPWQPFIDGFDRTFVRYGRPDQLINIVNRLNIWSDDTHLSSKLTELVSICGKPLKATTL